MIAACDASSASASLLSIENSMRRTTRSVRTNQLMKEIALTRPEYEQSARILSLCRLSCDLSGLPSFTHLAPFELYLPNPRYRPSFRNGRREASCILSEKLPDAIS